MAELPADPELVLHGGGNTSVKTQVTGLLGEAIDVLCVKGSGWDLATIEPAGHPAVRLEPLRELRALERLSDEDMVAAQRRNLIDPAAPNPSVEALLHAFLPHTFVDHTHATALLALADQPDAEAVCREVYGERVVLVPYVMPGPAPISTSRPPPAPPQRACPWRGWCCSSTVCSPSERPPSRAMAA